MWYWNIQHQHQLNVHRGSPLSPKVIVIVVTSPVVHASICYETTQNWKSLCSKYLSCQVLITLHNTADENSSRTENADFQIRVKFSLWIQEKTNSWLPFYQNLIPRKIWADINIGDICTTTKGIGRQDCFQPTYIIYDIWKIIYDPRIFCGFARYVWRPVTKTADLLKITQVQFDSSLVACSIQK